MDFTQEERMLMMIYNPGSREELVVELERETASASDRYRDR